MYMDRVQLPPVRQQQQQGPPQPHNGANCDPALGERVPEKPEKPAGYYGKVLLQFTCMAHSSRTRRPRSLAFHCAVRQHIGDTCSAPPEIL